MQLSIRSLLTAALAVASVEAQSAVTQCYTSYGSSSVASVSTTSNYHTVTSTTTSKVFTYSTTTVSPTITTTTTQVSTSTVTTTNSTQTDFYTAFTTVYPTTTITEPTSTFIITSTNTATATSTTTTTSTVAAPAGFTPIQGSLKNSGNDKPYMKKRSAVAKRSVRNRPLFGKSRKNQFGLGAAATYPVGVECEVYSTTYVTSTTTLSGRPGRTTTAPVSTSTVTQSTTITTTSTVYPPDVTASITYTITSTITTSTQPITTTSTTITSTTTTTSTQTAAPTYAQCGASNFADYGPATGDYFGGSSVYSTTGQFSYGTSDASPEACCTSCASYSGCIYFGFYLTEPAGQQCYMYSSTNLASCSAGQSANQWEANVAGGSPFLMFGNGACGKVDGYYYSS